MTKNEQQTDAKARDLPVKGKSVLVIADDHSRDAKTIKVTVKDMEYSSINMTDSAMEAVKLLESGVGDIFYVNL